MKFSFAVSLEKTSFDYIASNNRWQKTLTLLSDSGYDGVELSIRHPEKVRIDALGKTLKRHSLKLSAIGTGQAYIDDGLSLSSSKDYIRIKAINRIKKHIDLASFFDTQIILGLIRGEKKSEKISGSQYDKNLLHSTMIICDYAISKNVIVALEPLNRYETSFLNNVEESLAFLNRVKCQNLKLLLDTFHMNIEEGNIIESIQRANKFLSHFHLSDNNRRCPGDGSIDFRKIITMLMRLGYSGYLSGEMLPSPSVERCIKKFIKLIKTYIRNCK